MGERRDHRYAQPSLDDFARAIEWHLDRSLSAARQRIGGIETSANARGMLRSGNTIIETFQAAHKEFEGGVDTALGELKRAIQTTELDKDRLRKITIEALSKYRDDLKGLTGHEKMRKWAPQAFSNIDGFLAEFDETLAFKTRQFEVGFFDPGEPEVPPVTNYMHVGHVSGGAVQQGTSHSTQNVTTINIQVLPAAVAEFEKELTKASLPPNLAADIQADLETIKAQLKKPSPSNAVLKEVGHSLRSVLEGMTGGMLAPGALQAGQVLLGALGIM